MAARKKLKENDDAVIAAVASVICMFIVGAPAVGYFYIGNFKKGVEYIIAAWVLLAVAGVISIFTSFLAYEGTSSSVYMGISFFPILIPFAFDLVIVWDVYLEAKGGPTKLPTL